jgi:hypothetical protein
MLRRAAHHVNPYIQELLASQQSQGNPPSKSRRLLGAGDPAEVDLLGEGNSSIIVGNLAGLAGVGAGERNAVVDVEDTVRTAGRVDVRRGRDRVRLGVHLTRLPNAAAGDDGLGGGRGAGVLREVVGAEEGACYRLVQLSIAVVGAVDDGELEARWVLEVQVQLAVLGVVRHGGARADVGLEAVKSECDNLVRRRNVSEMLHEPSSSGCSGWQ